MPDRDTCSLPLTLYLGFGLFSISSVYILVHVLHNGTPVLFGGQSKAPDRSSALPLIHYVILSDSLPSLVISSIEQAIAVPVLSALILSFVYSFYKRWCESVL